MIKKIITENQDKLESKERPKDFKNLLNKNEDNDFSISQFYNQKSNHENREDLLGKVSHLDEETKHENTSYSDSIYAEIDQMLLESIGDSANFKGTVVDNKHVIRKRNINKLCLQHNSSNISRNDMKENSINSEFEHLASLILRENSIMKEKVNISHNISNSIIDEELIQPSFKKESNKAELIYTENINNQPNEKIFKKRKVAAQYMPYGVFTKQSGGLGRSTSKYYVRTDLMFNSKYDERLVAEILKDHKLSSKKPKTNKVIILGEKNNKICMCFLTNDILNKRNTLLEVFEIGNIMI